MKRSVKFNHLESRLIKQTGQAIVDFGMIEDGDRVLICMSGGKDSYTLLDILIELQRRAPIDFELMALNVDQVQPNFPADILPEYLTRKGISHQVVRQDTYSIVREKVPSGKTTCSLCSRLRRGIIYRAASTMGATKIALGHHRDDVIETFFLNLFYGGVMKGMPPKLLSDDGNHVVIRPLTYVAEKDITTFAALQDYPIIPCDLCGSQPNLQRNKMKEMLREWEVQFPGRIDSIARAMRNIVPSHLADSALYDFAGINRTSEQAGERDDLSLAGASAADVSELKFVRSANLTLFTEDE